MQYDNGYFGDCHQLNSTGKWKPFCYSSDFGADKNSNRLQTLIFPLSHAHTRKLIETQNLFGTKTIIGPFLYVIFQAILFQFIYQKWVSLCALFLRLVFVYLFFYNWSVHVYMSMCMCRLLFCSKTIPLSKKSTIDSQQIYVSNANKKKCVRHNLETYKHRRLIQLQSIHVGIPLSFACTIFAFVYCFFVVIVIFCS